MRSFATPVARNCNLRSSSTGFACGIDQYHFDLFRDFLLTTHVITAHQLSCRFIEAPDRARHVLNAFLVFRHEGRAYDFLQGNEKVSLE